MEKTILEIQYLSAGYHQKHILKNLSFSLKENEILGIVGESGSGKSTLANAITYFADIYEGHILFRGKDICHPASEEKRNIRKHIQMIIQDSKTSFNPSMKIKEYIAEPLKNFYQLKKEEIRKKSIELLNMVGLEENILERYPKQLSGGQRQRIAITRALAIQADIIICDEITSALDVSIQKQIISLLKELGQKQKLSYIFISHDIALVSELCDRILIMYQGEIVETLKSSELKQAKHFHTKELLASVFKI